MIASRDARLLLTLDKDFGELAFKQRLPANNGIILLRIHKTGAKAVTEKLIEVLQTRDDWEKHFSVIESDRIRVTPLPT